jgi:hypothetical protein
MPNHPHPNGPFFIHIQNHPHRKCWNLPFELKLFDIWRISTSHILHVDLLTHPWPTWYPMECI